jgi:hypothetical protein
VKYLSLAFVIAVLLSVAIYLAGHALLNDDKLVDAALSIPFVGLTGFAELIEKHDAKRHLASGKQGAAIPSLDGFSISWPLITTYSTIILIAVTEFLSLLTGAIAAHSGLNRTGAMTALVLVGFLIQLLAGYFVGRWIGIRGRNHGLMALFAAALLSPIIERTIESYFLSADEFRTLFGVERGLPVMAVSVAVGFAVLFLPGVLGYWRGKKQRLTKYLGFLLAILPEDTQAALVDLAVQEANALHNAKA